MEPIRVSSPVQDSEREHAVVSRLGLFSLVLEMVVEGGLGSCLDLWVEILAFHTSC